ncbi:MAG: MGMT family protein [Litorilinea sp.]
MAIHSYRRAYAYCRIQSEFSPMFTDPASPVFLRIQQLVSQIPAGKVATYGQIALYVGNCTPRIVGFAMAALPADGDVPWQRVINAQGKISLRADGFGSEEQRLRLEAEGVRFDTQNRVNLRIYGWAGPDLAWRLEHGYDPEDL